MATRISRASKKLIAAVGRYVLGGGPLPDEVEEIDVCQRMGWTLDELDRQDETRVMDGIQAANTRDALRRVKLFIDTHGKYKPANSDLEIYGWIKELMRDG